MASSQSAVTPHGLRRTFTSLHLAAKAQLPCVMAQAGQIDPKMTLRIYAKVIASEADRGAILGTASSERRIGKTQAESGPARSHPPIPPRARTTTPRREPRMGAGFQAKRLI
jgi:hypothetical protein